MRDKSIHIRAVEPEDIALLYKMENSPLNWIWGSQNNLLSMYDLKRFVEQSHKSITETSQKRFMVCLNDTNEPIGTIDLFDYDAVNRRVAMGMILYDTTHRGKGYGRECVELTKKLCFEDLSLHQIYVEISSQNIECISLFEKMGFKNCGTKRDWIIRNDQWQDNICYQLINRK